MRNRRRPRILLAIVLLLLAPGRPPAEGAATPDTRSAPDSSTVGFRLPLPPPPALLTPFRAPSHRYGPGHRGVDLAAAPGAAALAAGDGTVVYAGHLVDRGVVSVEHPSGLRTTYEPVTASVRAGATVSAGTVLGTVEPGHPSCAPAACLHWGARLPDDVYLDPLLLLGPLPVRLLPWSG